MNIKNWKSELTEWDEMMGRDPRFPIATEQEYLSYEFSKQNELIKSNGFEISNGIKNATSNICGSIENGFSELHQINENGFSEINSNLTNIESGLSVGFSNLSRLINNLEATNRWGFSKVIEQLQLSNVSLNEIIKLLNIPDIQKVRKYHLEQGMDFFSKGKFNPIFLSKSIDNFEKVIEIEDTDYFALTQLGIIHLYSKEQLDLNKAKIYFENAIIFGEAEINFQITKIGGNSSSFDFNFNPQKITSKNLMHLARINYIENNLSKSLFLSEKAYKIDNNNLSNIYDLAKYNALSGNEKNTTKFLEIAISKNRYIAVKTLSDKSLITRKYIQDLLNLISENAYINAKNKIQKVLSTINKNSIYINEITDIMSKLEKNNYLNSLEVIETLGYELNN